jgi:hypothetical protein
MLFIFFFSDLVLFLGLELQFLSEGLVLIGHFFSELLMGFFGGLPVPVTVFELFWLTDFIGFDLF